MNNKIDDYNKKRIKENAKIINHKKIYKLDFFKKGKNSLLALIDDNKKILVGEYNFYGIYQPYTKLWVWGSSIPGVDKKCIENINKIKKLNYLFEGDSNKKIDFYYQLLTQDMLLITDEKMLKWINDLIMFLSNDILIFTPTNSESNIQFITLKNIKEKYK
jgi:hypothetical protein